MSLIVRKASKDARHLHFACCCCEVIEPFFGHFDKKLKVSTPRASTPAQSASSCHNQTIPRMIDVRLAL
jgi:hypothetical protein